MVDVVWLQDPNCCPVFRPSLKLFSHRPQRGGCWAQLCPAVGRLALADSVSGLGQPRPLLTEALTVHPCQHLGTCTQDCINAGRFSSSKACYWYYKNIQVWVVQLVWTPLPCSTLVNVARPGTWPKDGNIVHQLHEFIQLLIPTFYY